MDARRVLLLRTMARAGSLSAAARELGWTQPAVSQQLQRLEREAGSPLLVRTSRGVHPTESGDLLLARADAIAAQLHMATEELAALADLREATSHQLHRTRFKCKTRSCLTTPNPPKPSPT